MQVKREFLGEAPNHAPIYAYRLINGNGMEVKVTNFGAIILNILVPDRDGKPVDVCLGQKDLSAYLTNPGCLGATVGPCANRTADASFSINGKKYFLEANAGVNNLHSSRMVGFQRTVWEEVSETEGEVVFHLKSADGEYGFPGNKDIHLSFSLSEENALRLHYLVKSDAPTWINMTNHCYFNLGGHASGSVEGHEMQLFAGSFTPVRAGSIPTGEIRSVQGTPFDFLHKRTIGEKMHEEDDQLKEAGGGYDHNFCIDHADGTLKQFADVYSGETGIRMRAWTTLPGFQFYAGVQLDIQQGKQGATYRPFDGFCLETQYYPNAINIENFESPITEPAHPYDTTTIYNFS